MCGYDENDWHQLAKMSEVRFLLIDFKFKFIVFKSNAQVLSDEAS